MTLTVVNNGRGETHHLIRSGSTRTLCNRNARDWFDVPMNLEAAKASAYCCRHCLAKLNADGVSW